VCLVWVGGDSLVNRLETVSGEVREAQYEARAGARRAEIWRATWEMIKAHPVAGVGFGGYWMAVPSYHDASGKVTPQQAHNDYLEVLASGGIIGALIVAWFAFALIRSARESFRRSASQFRRAAVLGALIGIFGAAVHSLVDFGLHITINALVLTALVVIATAEVETLKEAKIGGHARRSRI
jgi:O-antigen ligase